LALLGVTVTTMELPTAVPYFGAIVLLTTADLSMARWLPLLVLYNVILVLPPVLLLVGHIVSGTGWMRGTPTSGSDCRLGRAKRCSESLVSWVVLNDGSRASIPDIIIMPRVR
jgi:hypothetical protein